MYLDSKMKLEYAQYKHTETHRQTDATECITNYIHKR